MSMIEQSHAGSKLRRAGSDRFFVVAAPAVLVMLALSVSPVGVSAQPDASRSVGKTAAGGVRELRSWKHNTGNELNSIASMAFGPDGKALAAVGGDGVVRLWDPHTGKNIASWKGHGDYLNSVAFHPKGTLVASGGDDKLIKLWDAKTGGNKATLKGHSDEVRGVAFSPDGNTLVSVGGSILLWNVKTGANAGKISGIALTSIAFSPDGKLLATGSFEGTATLFSVASRKPVAKLQVVPREAVFGSVDQVVFSPDGKTLATGSRTVSLWEVKTRKRRLNFKLHKDSQSFAVAFSPDSRIVASVSVDSVIIMWDVQTGRELASFKAHDSTAHSLAFSPDGKLLASGASDNLIKIWDISSLNRRGKSK